MEMKQGPAPKILFEKVLTIKIGCTIITTMKDERGKRNVSGIERTTKQHLRRKKKMKTVVDHIAAEELFLYTVNNSTVYSCSIKPLIANYRRKIAKNQYDREKAIKGFEHVAKMGAMHYEKNFLSSKYYIVFNAATRREAAEKIFEYFEDEIMEVE